MATKIRLARHGKKGYPVYHIVIADSRSPRDGRFIEKLGTYNPNTNPATIDLNVDRAVYWVGVGAEPTDTTRAILSHKGVMLKHHLAGGVRKGALTEAQAEAKFAKWVEEKEAKIEAEKLALKGVATKSAKERMAAEVKVREERAAALAAKLAEQAAATTQTEAAEAVAEEAAAE